MTDYSKPQRMSAKALLIIFLKTSATILGTTSTYILFKLLSADFDTFSLVDAIKIIAGIAITLGISLILAILSYIPKKFHIENQNLIFTHGLLQRQTSTIPLRNIHSTRTRRGIFYRLLNMRGICFDTLASKGAEIELILDEADWQALLSSIDNQTTASPSHSPTDDLRQQPPPIATLIRLDNIDLLKDTLCQNHLKGLAILLGFIAVVFDRIINTFDNATEIVTDYSVSLFDHIIASPLTAVAALAIAYLLIMTLWVGKTLLQNYDMTVDITPQRLTFDRGLLSRSTNRFAFDKICTIWIKQNILERHLGLATMILRQAVNATPDKKDDNLKIYGSIASLQLIKWWLTPDYQQSQEIISAKSGRGLLFHTLIAPLIISLVASAALIHFGYAILAPLVAILPAIYLIKGLLAMRRSKIIVRQDYIEIHNGSFAEIRNYLKFQNIEAVRLTKSPFTRFTHRQTLTVSTPGSTFKIRSLPTTAATRLLETILSKKLITKPSCYKKYS